MSKQLPYNIPFGGSVGAPMPYIRSVRAGDRPDPVPPEIANEVIRQNAGAISSAYIGLQRLASGSEAGFYSAQRRLSDQAAIQYTVINGQEYVDVVIAGPPPAPPQKIKLPTEKKERLQISTGWEDHYFIVLFRHPDNEEQTNWQPINSPQVISLNGTPIISLSTEWYRNFRPEYYVLGTLPLGSLPEATSLGERLAAYRGLSSFHPFINTANMPYWNGKSSDLSCFMSYTQVPRNVFSAPGETSQLTIRIGAGHDGGSGTGYTVFLFQTLGSPTGAAYTFAPAPIHYWRRFENFVWEYTVSSDADFSAWVYPPPLRNYSLYIDTWTDLDGTMIGWTDLDIPMYSIGNLSSELQTEIGLQPGTSSIVAVTQENPNTFEIELTSSSY